MKSPQDGGLFKWLCLCSCFALLLICQSTACLPSADLLVCRPCSQDEDCGKAMTGLSCTNGVCLSPTGAQSCEPTEQDKQEQPNEQPDTAEKPNKPDEPKKPDEPGQVPDDGGIGPEPDARDIKIPDSAVPTIEDVNGDGTPLGINAKDSPSKLNLPTSDKVEAQRRIKSAIFVTGARLKEVTKWSLVPNDGNLQNKELTWTGAQIEEGTTNNMIKLSFSATKTILAAGVFLLVGTYTSGTVEAKVFILQGEKGDTGAKGDKGDKGDPGITSTEATELKKLATSTITGQLTSLAGASSKLTMLASQTTVTATELTFTTESITLDASKEVKLKSPTVTLETDTFSVKAKNNTELTVDGGKRTISMSVEEADKNLKATFSVEGGDNGANPVPSTKFPIARFTRANVMVQSGAGKTDDTTQLGLGNLFIGYNGKANAPTASRTGSHNLVVGDDHDYQGYGGFISGSGNITKGAYSTVAGGSGNNASGSNSTVAGGSGNNASGSNSTVAGGSGNTAEKDNSSVCSSVNVKIMNGSSTPLRFCCGKS